MYMVRNYKHGALTNQTFVLASTNYVFDPYKF